MGIARRGADTFKFKTLGGIARELRIKNGTNDDSELDTRKMEFEDLQATFVMARNDGDIAKANAVGEQVCEMMKKFIMDLADKKYKNYIEKDPSIKDDLVQSAYLAIFEQLPRYDRSKGAPTTFFVHAINHNMFTVVNQDGGTKRHQAVNAKRVKDAIEALGKRGIDDPSNADICIETGLDMNQVISTMQIIQSANTVSTSENFDVSSVGASDYGNPEKTVESSLQMQELYKVIASLPELERTLIMEVYFNDAQIKTVAAERGTSEEKIRKTINKALKLIQYDDKFVAAYGKKREAGYTDDSALSLIPDYSADKTADALFNNAGEELEIMFT